MQLKILQLYMKILFYPSQIAIVTSEASMFKKQPTTLGIIVYIYHSFKSSSFLLVRLRFSGLEFTATGQTVSKFRDNKNLCH